jgi:hypothetical protein
VSERPYGKPDHDIYTVLVILATAVTAAATIFLAVRLQQLFGSWRPF